MAEETQLDPAPDKLPRPSPINGPAFLVFGLLFVVLGFGMKQPTLVGAGAIMTLVGVGGVLLQRRYDKAAGIEEILPGGPPSASRAADEAQARPQASAEVSSEEPGTTSPDS